MHVTMLIDSGDVRAVRQDSHFLPLKWCNIQTIVRGGYSFLLSRTTLLKEVKKCDGGRIMSMES